MPQISSFGALPDPISTSPVRNTPPTAQKSSASVSHAAAGDEAQSPIQAQLTRLSGVLNSLQKNAQTNRAQYVQAFNQVKAGTYNPDALDVSRSIVKSLLTNQ